MDQIWPNLALLRDNWAPILAALKIGRLALIFKNGPNFGGLKTRRRKPLIFKPKIGIFAYFWGGRVLALMGLGWGGVTF